MVKLNISKLAKSSRNSKAITTNEKKNKRMQKEKVNMRKRFATMCRPKNWCNNRIEAKSYGIEIKMRTYTITKTIR